MARNDEREVGSTEPRRILGVDPGLNVTGYGVLQAGRGVPELVEAGVIRTGNRGSLDKRLRELYEGLAEILQTTRPTAMAIEELYSHYARPRTAILMGHARGVICLAAARREIPIVHYAATQVKRLLTGNGHAPKTQMQLAICRELRLAQPPDPPDVADALAIALCHHHLERRAA